MQTTINNRMPVACAGLIAHPFDAQKIRTCAAEGGAIHFGRAVVQGTAWNQAKLPTADTQKVVGITAFSNAAEGPVGSAVEGYAEKSPMNVMNFGEIWMEYTGTAPAVGAALFVVASGANAGKAITVGTGAITAPLVARYIDTSLALVLVSFTASV